MEQTKYLHELEIYDGEAFIVFNIISLSMKKGRDYSRPDEPWENHCGNLRSSFG